MIRTMIGRLLFWLLRKVVKNGVLQPGYALPVDVDAELKKLSKKYPHWRKTTESFGFKTWLSEQDEEMQRKSKSMLADDAIDVLAAYKSRLAVIKDLK